MRRTAVVVAAALLAACGPSASEREQAAGLIAEVLCTSDFLDNLNPLNPALAMNQIIPTFSTRLNRVSKRQVAAMRKLASTSDKVARAFAESVKLNMSRACPGRKNTDLAIIAAGALIGMIDQVPALRDAGI